MISCNALLTSPSPCSVSGSRQVYRIIGSDKDKLNGDDLYCERGLRARQVPLEQKVLAGTQLYDEVVERVRIGIRSGFPGLSEEQVNQTLIESGKDRPMNYCRI